MRVSRNLNHKVVVITGAAHGIGAQVARDLVAAGARVAVLDRDRVRRATTGRRTRLRRSGIRDRRHIGGIGTGGVCRRGSAFRSGRCRGRQRGHRRTGVRPSPPSILPSGAKSSTSTWSVSFHTTPRRAATPQGQRWIRDGGGLDRRGDTGTAGERVRGVEGRRRVDGARGAHRGRRRRSRYRHRVFRVDRHRTGRRNADPVRAGGRIARAAGQARPGRGGGRGHHRRNRAPRATGVRALVGRADARPAAVAVPRGPSAGGVTEHAPCDPCRRQGTEAR